MYLKESSNYLYQYLQKRCAVIIDKCQNAQNFSIKGNYLLNLTLTLLTWTIWRAPTSASKWRMGFNSAFKGLSNLI